MTEERALSHYNAQAPVDAALLEKVVVGGNLADLTPAQRLDYYRNVTSSLGLNPLTRPFLYITLNGKLTLYASRDCTDQLRKIHNVNITIVSRDRIEDVYAVTARATLPNGRVDESIGAVSIGGLKGDALANALMKAETKAKRRVTLSIVGLGMLDETEIETVRDARPVAVNMETGEIVESNGAGEPSIAEWLRQWVERIQMENPTGWSKEAASEAFGKMGRYLAEKLDLPPNDVRSLLVTIHHAMTGKWSTLMEIGNDLDSRVTRALNQADEATLSMLKRLVQED